MVQFARPNDSIWDQKLRRYFNYFRQFVWIEKVTIIVAFQLMKTKNDAISESPKYSILKNLIFMCTKYMGLQENLILSPRKYWRGKN